MTTAPPPPASPPPGLEPLRRRRERLLPFLLVIAVCFAGAAYVILKHRNRAVGLVQREDLARAGVVLVAAAQTAYRERAGHYGWVADLERNGLLDGLDVVTSTDGAWVQTSGYRLDVLLPVAELGGGVVAIVPPGDERRPDEALRQKHFVVVARPLEPGRTGYRMWYVDERGEMYLNEGVIDDDGALMNALPKALVNESMSLDTASLLLWQREADVRVNQD